MLWFPFELCPGDCGLVSEADTHLIAFQETPALIFSLRLNELEFGASS
jgi:hypothetical protein